MWWILVLLIVATVNASMRRTRSTLQPIPEEGEMVFHGDNVWLKPMTERIPDYVDPVSGIGLGDFVGGDGDIPWFDLAVMGAAAYCGFKLLRFLYSL